MNNYFVIGGGHTVDSYDIRELKWFGKAIGVNDAALWAPVHICLTMDRLWFEHRWPYLRTLRVAETYVREKCDCNVPRKDARDNWKTFKHFNKPGLGETPGELWGANSGSCAINLAFQLSEPGDRIFLLGFDMQKGRGGQPYWYPPYPWAQPEGATSGGKYKEWAPQFKAIGDHVRRSDRQILNVTHDSKIDDLSIPKITFERMWEMVE